MAIAVMTFGLILDHVTDKGARGLVIAIAGPSVSALGFVLLGLVDLIPLGDQLAFGINVRPLFKFQRWNLFLLGCAIVASGPLAVGYGIAILGGWVT